MRVLVVLFWSLSCFSISLPKCLLLEVVGVLAQLPVYKLLNVSCDPQWPVFQDNFLSPSYSCVSQSEYLLSDLMVSVSGLLPPGPGGDGHGVLLGRVYIVHAGPGSAAPRPGSTGSHTDRRLLRPRAASR